jgi:hypothetical protein
MFGVAEADLPLEGGFVRVKGAPGMRKSLAELVDANDRRSGASRWRVVASRAARVHRAHRRRGTDGSNPSPSSGESGTNSVIGLKRGARRWVRCLGCLRAAESKALARWRRRPNKNRGATQNAMRAFSGHLIGIELLGPLMGVEHSSGSLAAEFSGIRRRRPRDIPDLKEAKALLDQSGGKPDQQTGKQPRTACAGSVAMLQ